MRKEKEPPGETARRIARGVGATLDEIEDLIFDHFPAILVIGFAAIVLRACAGMGR